MTVFTNQFGPVQTAYVEYKLYSLLGDLTLFWPTAYQDSVNIVAAYMDIADNIAPANSISIPDARQVSVGQNFIISNIGAESFNVLDFAGGVINTIVAGTAWYFILTDNSTAAGTWHFLQFGAGSSSATAASLVGYGLNDYILPPINQSRLNTQINVNTAIPSNYNIAITDYASMLVWTGGTSSIFLPAVSPTPSPLPVGQVPPFYYVSINNAGTGALTLSSIVMDGIQGQVSLSINPGQTLIVATPGYAVLIGTVQTKWFTLGYGQQNLSNITVLDKSVAGNNDIILTASEASNDIQQYTGVLTGNITVFFPTVDGEWFIFNDTTGAFSLSVQLGTPGTPIGNIYVIPQGERRIFYSDSESMFDIPTGGGGGTVTSVGIASNTGLTITGSPITTAGTIDVNLPNGTIGQVLVVNGTGPQTIGWISKLQDNIVGNLGVSLGRSSNLSVTTNPSVVVGVNNYNTTATGNGNNIAYGNGNLFSNTTGANNIAVGVGNLAGNTTGNNNVGLGTATLSSNTSGDSNVGIGYQALNANTTGIGNVGLGVNAGLTQTNNINCTFLGSLTNATAINLNSSTAIGVGTQVSASFVMNLGNDVNIGLNNPTPTMGLHLGPAGAHFTPAIRIPGIATPGNPGVAGDAIIYVSTLGQPSCRSGTIKHTGAIVVANSIGAAPTAGLSTLVAGTVTIATTAVTGSSVILVTYNNTPAFNAANAGFLYTSLIANTSITITSSNVADTNGVGWQIINPASI